MKKLKIYDEIVELVSSEPRTVNEIKEILGLSWATANKYAEEIVKLRKDIALKTIRVSNNRIIKLLYARSQLPDVQQFIERMIERARRKYDFSPFDIFQFVPGSKKRFFVETYKKPEISTRQNIIDFFAKTEEELLIFAGNMTFINMIEHNKKLIDEIKKLLKREVEIKILARIDIGAIENYNKLMNLPNSEYLKIMHIEQPLRGMIRDRKIVRLKEEKYLEEYPTDIQKLIKKKNKKVRVFYEFWDKRWVEWLSSLFYRWFSISQEADKRIHELNKVFSEIKREI